MLQTANIISKLDDVPKEWVFEYYLSLGTKLSGQDVKMKSCFNKKDKTPSMFVFVDKNKLYKFKCFSSGRGGDGVSLVKFMFNLQARWEAAEKIVQDYNEWKLSNNDDYSLRSFKQQARYKVVAFKKRPWNANDKDYWTDFKIGSKLLESFNAFPLESYTLSKTEEDGSTMELVISGERLYGYFKNDGTLYKIYQPMMKERKFIKISAYVQGYEQLTYKKPYLVITSSLKDIMAVTILKFSNIELVAPDSENTLIPESMMIKFLDKYEGICTLFDNDSAGIEAAAKYQVKYGVPPAILEMEKDPSDSVKVNGPMKVREALIPILRKALSTKEVDDSKKQKAKA